ncbi:hypothetical protein KPL71_000949 [Citrus sinensis]|uniref:Uncharacterized protein n=1 Tax=Citrus sinensis TaxID=2711 RepID=A0ACB8NUH3_CITSI|nr:hypothetical protein KPL71_000949 [Citrus sinensis]
MRKYKSVDFQFDPEIERTARRLRREHRELQAVVAMDDLQNLRNLNCREGIQLVNVHEGLNGQCVQRQPGNNNIIHMANDRDRAIRDYAVLTPQAIHPGIVRPDVQGDNFELKLVMFQMLQTVGQFNGLPSEDPHLHLKLFLEVSDAFKIAGASQEPLRLILFPFSLIDRARAWLNSLPPDSITTWSDLADKFLLKYFPPTKNAKLRNEITSFHQLEDESLCDAWERFKELLRKCHHHGISCCIQLETFYNGLNPSTRLMVDASANGALLSKSYNEAYEILERIANNNYQWPSTRQAAARGTTGVHNVDSLTTLAAQLRLTIWAASIDRTRTIHIQTLTTLDGDSTQTFHRVIRTRLLQHLVDRTDLLNHLDFISKIKSKETSIMITSSPSKLAAALSNRPQGSLPSNTEDPRREEKEHCKVINLRSGKDVHSPVCVPKRRVEPTSIQKETQIEKESQSSTSQHTEALEQMPNYAKKFKDILTKKRRLGEFETVTLTQECSRMLQSKIPQKMKDPGSFTIPYSIGTKYSGKALCDLGASINLMPLSVFKQLGVGECRPTTVSLQLADRSHAYPEGKIEYVLVKVDKFIFPVDFIVLDFEADKEVPIILGRPFLATGKTLIDVQKGELTMRVNDQQVTFNVLDVMKSPDEIEDCNFISVMDFVVAERLHSCCSKEEINYVTIEELDDEDHGAANIAWLGEKQYFKIDEQIQQRELTPEQQEFKGNRPRVKHYMGDDVNNLRKDRFLKDPG